MLPSWLTLFYIFLKNQLGFQEKRETVAMDYSSSDFLIIPGVSQLVAWEPFCSFPVLGAGSDSSEVTCPRLTCSGRFSLPSTSQLFLFVLQQHFYIQLLDIPMHSCTCIIDPTVGSLVKEITSEDLYLLQHEDPIFLQGRKSILWLLRRSSEFMK